MYKILLSVSLLSLSFSTGAQTAADYFHRGAQFYVWGEKERSKNEVVSGLRLFPTDPLLNGMAALLKKEEQKQEQQQSQQNQQSDQQQQQNQKQEQSQSQQQQQSKEEQPQQEQSAANQQDKQQEQAQQQQQEMAKAAEDQKEKEEQAAAAAGEMTPEQARQLLDAQKGQEKMLSQKLQKPADRSKRIKDW